MSVNEFTGELLQRQLLTLDVEDREKLEQAVVVVAGIGGIGCTAVEVLARNAVGTLILADNDAFDGSNARQLYMTQHTIGRSKTAIARQHISELNPGVRLREYAMGVTPVNANEICAGAEVICDQVDQLAANILLHVTGDRHRIPVVSASRTRWPERHFLGVKVYDYRRPEQYFDVTAINITARWGVDEALVRQLLQYAERELPCDEVIHEINEQNQRYRVKKFLELLRDGDVTCISEKRREYLLDIAESYPELFHKMAISPEEAIVMGCLAGTAVKDLILGREYAFFEVNLYDGLTRTLSDDDRRAIHDMSAQTPVTNKAESLPTVLAA